MECTSRTEHKSELEFQQVRSLTKLERALRKNLVHAVFVGVVLGAMLSFWALRRIGAHREKDAGGYRERDSVTTMEDGAVERRDFLECTNW